MKAYYAFFCGSLMSALISFGMSILSGSHVGRALSFAIIGTGGGLALSAIGLAILFIIWCCKDKGTMPEASTDRILLCFFLPIVIVLGATWLFSLQTSAN